MILEAIVRKSKKSPFVVVGDTSMTLRQKPEDEDYSNVCHRLQDGEKVFVIPSSKTDCHLVVNFNAGMEDYFFQRMFGNAPPRRRKTTFYQRRIIAAKNAIGYQR